MNKIFRFISLLSFSSMMIISCDSASKDSHILKGIALSGDYQTEFVVGESFSSTGLVVTAIYSDQSTEVVSDYQISTPDMMNVGDKDIVVTYQQQSATYSISVINESYQGYIKLAFYHIDIALNDNTNHYLNPEPIDYIPNPDLIMPYTFATSDLEIATVTSGGGIKSAKNRTGTCVISCTGDTGLVAKCTVNVMKVLPSKEKGWVRVDDYDSLKDKDVLVLASPEHGVTASLDTLHSKLNPVVSSFSGDKRTITSLGEGTIEFYLGFENKGMTLEAQTGEYLVCNHQGKVKLDKGSNTNKYWDIHSNIDTITGEGSIEDGVVIENIVESLGYMMFNISLRYFTTYVENSISKYMALPFLYRLQELN